MHDSELTGDGAVKWRDKYLDALDAQEQQEKAYQAESQLLAKALARVSLAAEGQHPELDQVLEALRRSLRADDKGSLGEHLQRLEQSLLDVERYRDKNTAQQSAALQAMAARLQQLTPERALKKQLRSLSLDATRQRNRLDAYPELLHTLEQLQEQVLAERVQETARPASLLTRLFGAGSDAHGREAAAAAPGQEDEHLPPGAEQGSGSAVKADRALFELNPNATLRDSETVSDNLRAIINELLLSVEAQAIAPERVSALQHRLRSGISNADLLPALGEVRDLVLAAYMAATRAFTGYLTEVNEQLVDIYQVIEGAAQQSDGWQQASDQMQQKMLSEFAELEGQSARAESLDALKHQVQNRLGNIRAALQEYQSASERDHPVTEQLNLLAARVREMEQEATHSREVLEEQRAKALSDPLTGMPNREAYNERIHLEQQRFQRYGHPLTLAVCDLDYFKNINDTLGHQAGDRVLKVLSSAIAKRLREVDFFGRYGGEEFVIVMPETNAEQAFGVLDRIRAAIAKTAFNYKDTPVDITVSIGIAEFRAGADESAELVFGRADKALYDAKAAGRNTCMLASGE
ncbi:diguanylate cyclase [uncultured Gilvimarinus sp.]|uniref:GGDEF domain-containing protein n=1 Tax=uncultured Gilvimarinus sp. TaxID=1689143 RepID=UPI0030EE7A4F|tara:strand:+ start:4184 stop:5920 length:1737 start_codon:yes stop_codon:yes gene_type:complete